MGTRQARIHGGGLLVVLCVCVRAPSSSVFLFQARRWDKATSFLDGNGVFKNVRSLIGSDAGGTFATFTWGSFFYVRAPFRARDAVSRLMLSCVV